MRVQICTFTFIMEKRDMNHCLKNNIVLGFKYIVFKFRNLYLLAFMISKHGNILLGEHLNLVSRDAVPFCKASFPTFNIVVLIH